VTGNTVQVRNYQTRQQAEIDKSLLESHGIMSTLHADDYGGMDPLEAQARGGACLHVLEKDLERAAHLLSMQEGDSLGDPRRERSLHLYMLALVLFGFGFLVGVISIIMKVTDPLSGQMFFGVCLTFVSVLAIRFAGRKYGGGKIKV
jgi:hypothetical protein